MTATAITINPSTGREDYRIPYWDSDIVKVTVDLVVAGNNTWKQRTLPKRIEVVLNLAQQLRQNRQDYAELITSSMGKIIVESEAEVEKCIFTCEYYAEHAQSFLADEIIESDATQSLIRYEPLGTILGVMPWNFPLWQVFRFAVPTLLAGNTVVLKHASSISRAAIAIEQLFHSAGIPRNVFRCIFLAGDKVKNLLQHPGLRGVAFTGSEPSGKQLASVAGSNLKPVLLELGGSDAFVVLNDANLNHAVAAAVSSRFFTSGQSCINAKRIILAPAIANKFMRLFSQAVARLVVGDPSRRETQVGPMAREDLRTKLHEQVQSSLAMGAKNSLGCEALPQKGFYYAPSILDYVTPAMPAFREELFGPVAAIIRAESESHAIELANQSDYGLGASIWSQDIDKAKLAAHKLESGMVFINSIVRSDPRLPFGGIKNSGVGRELHRDGIRAFCNAKTVFLA